MIIIINMSTPGIKTLIDGNFTRVLISTLSTTTSQPIPSTFNNLQVNNLSVETATIGSLQVAGIYQNITPITIVDSAYTLLSSDNIIEVDSTTGAIVIKLPIASTSNEGQTYTIKDIGGDASVNNITISTLDGSLIEGSSTVVITTNYGNAVFYNDGVNWYLMNGSKNPSITSSDTNISVTNPSAPILTLNRIPILDGIDVGAGTLILPTHTTTLIGSDTSDTLTNKSFGNNINMNNNYIQNVQIPLNPGDAANKYYVDNSGATVTASNGLIKIGNNIEVNPGSTVIAGTLLNVNSSAISGQILISTGSIGTPAVYGTVPSITQILNVGTLSLPQTTDTLVGRNTSDTLSNKALVIPTISQIINNGTLSLPTSSTTLSGINTFDILTNKTFGNTLNMNGNSIQNLLLVPVNPADASSKSYVDSVASGLSIKAAAMVATTGGDLTTNTSISSYVYNDGDVSGTGEFLLTLVTSNTLIIDSVTLTSSNINARILIKDQTNQVQNGIYIILSFSGINVTLDRSSDADTGSEFNTGAFIFIEEGTINASTGWTLVTPPPITPGTTALMFSQFSATPPITASNGLVKIVNNIEVNPGSTIIAGTNLDVNSSGVAGQVLVSTGSIGTPAVYGTLPINGGGTNTTSFSNANSIVVTNNSNNGLTTTFTPEISQILYPSAGTLSLPQTTDTLIGRSTSDTLSNKTFSTALTDILTSNQIVLGLTNTTTINASAPATSQIITIPDYSATSSTSNFVVDSGGSLIITNSASTNQVLTATGTSSATWQTHSVTAPGGTNTAIQYNNSGAFGGDSTDFSWNDGTSTMTIVGTAVIGNQTIKTSQVTTSSGGYLISALGVNTISLDTNSVNRVTISATGLTIGGLSGAGLIMTGSTTGSTTFIQPSGASLPTTLSYTWPSVAPSASQVLTSSGGNTSLLSWTTIPSTNPGGTNTAIQYNSSSTFAGDAANFSWNDSSKTLGITGMTIAGSLTTPIISLLGNSSNALKSTGSTFTLGTTDGSNLNLCVGNVNYFGISGSSGNVQTFNNLGTNILDDGSGDMYLLGQLSTNQNVIAATGLIVGGQFGGVTGIIQLYNAANTFETSFKAPVLTSNIDYTLPITAPTANQVLTSNGGAASTLIWTTPSIATPGGTSTAIQYNSSSTFAGDAANFSWNDSSKTLGITGMTIAGSLTAPVISLLGTSSNTLNSTGNVFTIGPTDAHSLILQTAGATALTISSTQNTTLAAGKSLTLSGNISGTVGLLASGTTTSYNVTLPAAGPTVAGTYSLTTSNTSSPYSLAFTVINGATFYGTNSIEIGAGGTQTTSQYTTIYGSGAGNASNGSSDNTFIGYQAGNATTATDCTLIGFQAGLKNVNGVITAIGSGALGSAVNGSNTCTAVGYSALGGTITGSNTAVGHLCLTGACALGNTGMGTNCGQNVTGTLNTLYGYLAGGTVLTTGTNNCIFGQSSTTTASGTSNCVILGSAITSGATNEVVIGNSSNTVIRTDGDNVASLGLSTKRFTTLNCFNTTLYGSTSGNVQLIASATTTSYSIALPSTAPTVSGQSLTATTAGVASWTTISGASFYGTNSLEIGSTATSGSFTTIYGVSAGNGNGSSCTYIGYRAGTANTGNANIYIGANAGYSDTNGLNNTIIGTNSFAAISGGRQCSGVGTGVLSNCTGNNNTALGYLACGTTLATGTNNTIIGSSSDTVASGTTNAVVLGYNITSAATNEVVIGNSTNTVIRTDSNGLCNLGSLIKKFNILYSNQSINTAGTTNQGYTSTSSAFNNTGTITSQVGGVVTGSSTTFTASMIDGILVYTGAGTAATGAIPTAGSFGRIIAYSSATSITLDTTYAFTSVAGATFSIYSGNYYNTNTVTVSGTTVTGSSTTFTSAMLNGTIVFANGVTANITVVGSTTSLTIDRTLLFSSATNYTIFYGGVQTYSSNGTNAGGIVFNQANNANSIKLSAPATGVVNYGITLPATAPSLNNQSLTATTAGVASWTSINGANLYPSGSVTSLQLTNGSFLTTGTDITSVGIGAGASSAGTSDNTFLGFNAGNLVTGNSNTYIGSTVAANAPATGNGNTGLGYKVLSIVSSGAQNVGIGSQVLPHLTTSSNNTVIGFQAGNLVTSASNTLIGYTAGGTTLTTGANCTIIGAGSDTTATSTTNAIIIGYNITSAATNEVVIGNSSNTVIRTDSNGLCNLGSLIKKFNILYSNQSINTAGTTNQGYTSTSNTFNNTGTITSQVGGVVTGSSTTFTASMVDGILVYTGSGTAATGTVPTAGAFGRIIAYSSATSITLDTTYTFTSVAGLTFSIYSGNYYNTNTVTVSGTTVTGSSTTFTSSMINGVIVFADGVTANITAVGSTTSLTIDRTLLFSSATNYTIFYGGVQTYSSNGTNSAGIVFNQANNANSITLSAPATGVTNYGITLPPTAPSANGQILSATTGGIGSWVTNTGANFYPSGSITSMQLTNGTNLTTGTDNTSIGVLAGAASAGTSGNTSIGYSAGNANTSNNCTFVGKSAGTVCNNTINDAFGANSLSSCTGGGPNCAFGYDSLLSGTSISFNAAFGTQSLSSLTAANNNNSAFGYQSGKIVAGASNNSLFGSLAGGTVLTTGGNNCIFGASSTTVASSTANCCILGYNISSAATNEIVIGNSTNTVIRTDGDKIATLGLSTKRFSTLHHTNSTYYGSTSGNVSFTASPTTTTYACIWPPAVASTNQVLTDVSGNGTLSWATPTVSAGTTNQIIYNNGTSLVGSSAMTFNGTSIILNPSSGNVTINCSSTSGEIAIGQNSSGTPVYYFGNPSGTAASTSAFGENDGSGDCIVGVGVQYGTGTNTINIGDNHTTGAFPSSLTLMNSHSTVNDTISMGGIFSTGSPTINIGTVQGGTGTSTINIGLTTWPTAQGAASTVLTNNGSGTLTWASAPSSTFSYTSANVPSLTLITTTTNLIFGISGNPGGGSLELPSHIAGLMIVIVDEAISCAANPIPIQTYGNASLIQGLSTVNFNISGGNICLYSNGTNWFLFAGFLPSQIGSVTAGTASGSSPTIQVTGNDRGGHIQVIAGSTPTGTSVITYTFASSFQYYPGVTVIPGNNSAALLNIWVSSASTTSFTITLSTSSIPLVAASTYIWNYTVQGTTQTE